jgi:hypothetical protein
VNLLVHMDARGTLSMYTHLGVGATCLREGCGPGCAARLIPTTALGLTAALGSTTERDLHRSSGSVAGTPGCCPGQSLNRESVKVKGKQNVLHSCIRHGLNLLLDTVCSICFARHIVSDCAPVRMTGLMKGVAGGRQVSLGR